MRKRRFTLLILFTAVVFAAAACSAEGAAGSGTLTAVASGDLASVYEEIAGTSGGGLLPTAVSPTQINAGDATGWQYLWEEPAAPHVELTVYEKGQLMDTVTVLPGAEGLSGAILFGASDSESGYIWSTDLHDESSTQSHRYTYRTDSRSEPRRLAAGTTALEPGEEVWLAALLYGLDEDDRPTDISALQNQGLENVPLAAVLSVSFAAAEQA